MTNNYSSEATIVKNAMDSVYSNKNHSHNASDVLDSNSHSNIGTLSGASQSDINNTINNRIGNIIQILLGTGD